MSELLLELLSEEIPAVTQGLALQAFKESLVQLLTKNQISFVQLRCFMSTRRLTFYCTGLPSFLDARIVKIKGPRTSVDNSIIERFCKSYNINPNTLITELINDNMFYVYEKHIPQTSVQDILRSLIPEFVFSYTWPKSMYWGSYDIKWIRPLRNILCIFDGKPLDTSCGHLVCNDITYGHKFLCNKQLKVKSFEHYGLLLEQNYVIFDHDVRKDKIRTKLLNTAKHYGLNIQKTDGSLLLEDLLDEVTAIVENPVVMIGKIPEEFLELPEEVLITSMRNHQKYFYALDALNNKLAPYFLFVSNNLEENSELIIAGNEKVLSARLSDALYFYRQDKNVKLEAALLKIDSIIFHANLGSMHEKVNRIVTICGRFFADNSNIVEAAKLCKIDLASQMVQEFPELQGIIGYYYSMHYGASKDVATIIRDHYKPYGLSDEVPQGDCAKLALADKLDSLVGLMSIGVRATGSKDPYALRRYAISIIRIILGNPNLAINLTKLVKFASDLYKYDDFDDIIKFLHERTEFYFKDQFCPQLVKAVLETNVDDLHVIKYKLLTLKNFTETNLWYNFIECYKRVSNITQNSEACTLQQELLIHDSELRLYESFINISKTVDDYIARGVFDKALSSLQDIQSHLGQFFDQCLVNDDNPTLRNNRLSLLLNIKSLFLKIAKFDHLLCIESKKLQAS